MNFSSGSHINVVRFLKPVPDTKILKTSGIGTNTKAVQKGGQINFHDITMTPHQAYIKAGDARQCEAVRTAVKAGYRRILASDPDSGRTFRHPLLPVVGQEGCVCRYAEGMTTEEDMPSGIQVKDLIPLWAHVEGKRRVIGYATPNAFACPLDRSDGEVAAFPVVRGHQLLGYIPESIDHGIPEELVYQGSRDDLERRDDGAYVDRRDELDTVASEVNEGTFLHFTGIISESEESDVTLVAPSGESSGILVRHEIEDINHFDIDPTDPDYIQSMNALVKSANIPSKANYWDDLIQLMNNSGEAKRYTIGLVVSLMVIAAGGVMIWHELKNKQSFEKGAEIARAVHDKISDCLEAVDLDEYVGNAWEYVSTCAKDLVTVQHGRYVPSDIGQSVSNADIAGVPCPKSPVTSIDQFTTQMANKFQEAFVIKHPGQMYSPVGRLVPETAAFVMMLAMMVNLLGMLTGY